MREKYLYKLRQLSLSQFLNYNILSFVKLNIDGLWLCAQKINKMRQTT